MASAQTRSSQIYESDIQSLRTELRELSSQQAQLQTQLSALERRESVRSALGRGPSAAKKERAGAGESEGILALINAKYSQQTDVRLQHLYRMASVTGFTVRDPVFAGSKGAETATFLGVRIDMFADNKFAAPHYIIVGHGADGPYVHAHTAPAHIDVDGLGRRHLRAGVGKFVRAVRRRLVADARKRALLAALPDLDAIEADAGSRLVRLEFSQGAYAAHVACGDTAVTGAVVRDPQGRRNARLERAFRGPLATLAARLADAGAGAAGAAAGRV
ncbi:uncharacterized protein V1510DRAFT_424143 [Dipodascopsis tothii]|uniref:uncharacterized protein n=1 Tax=Dipodascopsis tothii TaxID=44089 RepID=UPI0034CFC6F5